MPLQPHLVIDFVGLINPPSNPKLYILVCTNFVTKWVEAKALTRAIEEAFSDFMFEDFFFRYGIPHEIVIDDGSQFTYNLI